MCRLKVGITGGIGSGKSMISQVFAGFGIPVFNADQVAKQLMEHDEPLKQSIKSTFGADVYDEAGHLQRALLAGRVFSDPQQLAKLNALVHPAAIRAGEEWAEAQKSIYSLKEAALLFESGSYQQLDAIILVTAPLSLRVQRVIKRDGVSEAQVMERVQKQWPDEQKIPLATYLIQNDDLHPVLPQVLAIHNSLIEKAQHASHSF